VNKADLVVQLARQSNISRNLSEQFLNTVIKVIQTSVSEGNEVKIVGFGTFDQAKRRARKGRNPKTGASVNIPACTVPRFRPGKDFKNALNS
jgi:DNA-binding protein HU-beta